MVTTLKCRYIPTIKCDTVGKYEFDDPRRYEAMSSEQFQSFFGKPKPNIEGAGVVAAGVAVSTTTSPTTPTPRMIYAKAIYGIEYADFTEAKFNTEANTDLGINDKSKLIPEDERKKNFILFKEKHFPGGMDTPYAGEKPTTNTEAYKKIEKYALSSYGSLMIRRVLTEPKKPIFKIGTEGGSQARGSSKDNFIILPPDFPSMEYFPVGGQKILGVAIIHHEFEHTQYGDYDNPKSLKEERLAVRYKENPVRIINDEDPRYVYYDPNTKYTINILTKEIKKGKWTYNKTDPSKPMIEVK